MVEVKERVIIGIKILVKVPKTQRRQVNFLLYLGAGQIQDSLTDV